MDSKPPNSPARIKVYRAVARQGNLAKSPLRENINAGDMITVQNFRDYCKGGTADLTGRRQSEANLFFHGRR